MWEPINTAPLDKRILITRDYNNAPIGLARWDGKYWRTGMADIYVKPTHWCELPEGINKR